jgi:DNA topoisomerase-2
MLERNCEYLSTVLSNKVRFIEMFVEGKINLARGTTTKADTIGFLKDQGYTSKNDLDKIRFIQGASESKNTDSPLITPDDVEVQDGSYDDFDYLLNLPLASLTSDRIDSLSSEKARSQETLNNIQDMSAEDLWRIDLDRLSTHL